MGTGCRLIKGVHMTPQQARRRVFVGACDLDDVLWRWTTRVAIPVLEVWRLLVNSLASVACYCH